jgi:uncharacterized protein YaiL (DUF2058 family)
MAYKYLTTARINSTIKKHKLEIIKGEDYFYFLDLETGTQVGDSVPVAKLWHLSIDKWREAAAEARAGVVAAPSEADEAVRELAESLVPA